jgi:hypothetical protein
MEVSGELRAPADLLRSDRAPGTHWTGGWVGPRIGLDAMEKRKILRCRESKLGHATRSPSLYRRWVIPTPSFVRLFIIYLHVIFKNCEIGLSSIGITLIQDFMNIRHLFQFHYEKHLQNCFYCWGCNHVGKVLLALTTLTAMKCNRENVDIHILLSWVMTLCSCVRGNHCFRGTCYHCPPTVQIFTTVNASNLTRK